MSRTICTVFKLPHLLLHLLLHNNEVFVESILFPNFRDTILLEKHLLMCIFMLEGLMDISVDLSVPRQLIRGYRECSNKLRRAPLPSILVRGGHCSFGTLVGGGHCSFGTLTINHVPSNDLFLRVVLLARGVGCSSRPQWGVTAFYLTHFGAGRMQTTLLNPSRGSEETWLWLNISWPRASEMLLFLTRPCEFPVVIFDRPLNGLNRLNSLTQKNIVFTIIQC